MARVQSLMAGRSLSRVETVVDCGARALLRSSRRTRVLPHS